MGVEYNDGDEADGAEGAEVRGDEGEGAPQGCSGSQRDARDVVLPREEHAGAGIKDGNSSDGGAMRDDDGDVGDEQHGEADGHTHPHPLCKAKLARRLRGSFVAAERLERHHGSGVLG